MPFIPHTQSDISAMLATIGAENIDDLFDEIDPKLRTGSLQKVPDGINEMEMLQHMAALSTKDSGLSCFIGAGAYEHHIPSAIWDIITRGEFMTAYTPYQAEASQGTLQLVYEFQTMLAKLTAMEVANASLYDGASALAEAVLMAVRANRQSKAKRVLVPTSVHPNYRKTTKTIVNHQKIELVDVAFNKTTGSLDLACFNEFKDEITAIVIQQPNFFGAIEDVDQLTDWAHAKNALVIAVVNPTSLGVLKPPGEWGEKGADIVVGEGQPFGIPLASGGPYYGFMSCRQQLVRQMPGRIIGRTVDLDGNVGYALTLQAREQHIRRSKATSNICTNQGLAMMAGTIYMSLLGYEGISQVAKKCYQNTHMLVQKLLQIPGIELVFNTPYFHEAVLRTPIPAADFLKQLEAKGILGGYALKEDYPELKNAFVLCATETKSVEAIDEYVQMTKNILNQTKSVEGIAC